MTRVKQSHFPMEDEIVITGISGRFPIAEDIDEFREKLFNKEDLIRPKEESNWNNEKLGIPNFVGQISNKNKFDAMFFGVNPKHCASTDPYVRILLEKVFEAIVDAGLNPSELRGTNTAVFTGSNISESENTYIYIPVKNNLAVMGHCRAMLSNRISYWLNVYGTSLSMVSMETSGFEALSAAYNEMKRGRCDAAVVGAVNLVMHPEMSFHYNELGVLSKDGKCRAFDAEADGYARSEGITVLFLQKARDAKRIYATVVNSEFDGCGDRNIDFTTPFGEPLSSLMERFYDACGVDPVDVDYLEAEGCGTKLGDEEEMRAVDKVLLRGRKTPLLVGSVKSNMGHGNAAANLCSVAKVLIAMQSGVIPPNLHYRSPAPGIPALMQSRAKVVTEETPWKGGLVALNSMGMTGTYAHVLLRSYDRDKPADPHSDGLPRLITISSRTEEGIQQILDKLESKPVDVEFIHLLHDVYSGNISNHLYRGYTIVPPGGNQIHEFKHCDLSNRPVWFIFSGMGSQWPGMGLELMKLPICAATIDKCHIILAEKGLDLIYIITTSDPHVFDNILHCFVAIAAIQLALLDMLMALGIKPDGMVGHSVGELGCAYADGCFTLDQMILAAYYRGRASQEANIIAGSMAAVGLGYEQIKQILPPEIDIACRNSSESCTLSGPVDDIKIFVAKLQSYKIFSRAVNVANIAYHSRYVQPAAPLLLEYLQKLIPDPKPRSTRWVSSSIPEEQWDTPAARYCSAEYHTNNLLSPVLFEDATKHIPKNAIAIEVAPHGLLQAILRRSLGPNCTNIPLTQRSHPQGLHFMLAAIGKLYLAGLTPQVMKLYPPVQLPVSRGTPSISPLITWDHTASWYTVGEVDKLISGERKVLVSLNQEEYRAHAGYVVNGCILFPAFAYLKIVWETIAILRETTVGRLPVMFEDVRFLHQLQIEERGSQMLCVLVQRGSGEFEISNDKLLLVTGKVTVLNNVEDMFTQNLSVPIGGVELTGDDLYMELEQRGYHYSGIFRGVQQVTLGHQGSRATVQWADDWVAFGEALLQVVMLKSAENNQSLQLPAALQKVVINPQEHKTQTVDMVAVFHHATGVVCCGGMELLNLRTTPFLCIPSLKPHLTLEAVRFVANRKPNLQTVQQFIAMSLQQTIENCHSDASVGIVDDNAASLLPHIKSLLTQYPQMTLNNISAQDLKQSGDSYSLVIVARGSILEPATAMLSHGGFMLARTDDDVAWQVDSNLVTVAKQQFGNEKILLLRKSVLLNENTSKVVHLTENISTWLQQIKMSGPRYRLYAVIDSDLGVESVSSFIRKARKNPGLEHVRYVFILDKKAPKFSLTEDLYREQLCQDLVVNIFRNGQWGSFYNIPLDSPNISKVGTYISELQSMKSLEDIELGYLGLNPQDWTISDTKTDCETRTGELNLLEFSGYLENGQRLMGVARMDPKTQNVVPERQLTWHIPTSWTLEDAATVPLAYAVAYNSLFLKAKVERGESILVHAGWSSIGQAAITLALDYDCTVFTTAANEEQKTFIMQQFPQLPEKHIYSCEDSSFEINVLTSTSGEGVKIVLNCLTSSKLQASLRCLGHHGRFVQLGQSALDSNQSVGMEVFLKNRDMIGITTSSLFNMSPEWKEALHSGVQERIQRGVVQPIQCTIFPRQQAEVALQAVTDMHHTRKVVLAMMTETVNFLPQTRLICDPQNFYLVVGAKVDQCLDVAEWLASHGVQKVAITVKSKIVPNHVERKIGLLQSYHNTQVVLIVTMVVNTPSTATKLLQDASSAFNSALAGIFILPVEPVDQENVTASTVASLDKATWGMPTVRHFVCLLVEDSWSTCETRHNAGLPALAALCPQHGDKGFNLLRFLHVLDTFFTTNIQDSVIIVSENKKENNKGSNAVPTLDKFLPSSVEDLVNLGEDLLSNSSTLVMELPTLSPGHGNIKEVPPVFLIPGLQGPPCEVLKPLARRLMYPALCIRFLQTNAPITDMAAALVKHVLEVQKMGPYNLVGISWGGALTLELARQLESLGHKTRVIIVDGAPETTQETVRQLQKGGELETNLVSRLLRIPLRKVAHSHNWSTLLTEALEEFTSSMKPNLLAALTALHSCLITLLQYKPSGELLRSEVKLVRPSGRSEDNNCGLDEFFKQTVRIHTVEGDHMTILMNPKMARIINDFVL